MGDDDRKLKVYFNPFAFTVEENNKFLALGYEPIPMRVPRTDHTERPNR